MRNIDVQKLSDDAKFGGLHKVVLFWCASIIVFDGYDLAVVGIALPSIMKDMGVDATSAGFMVSAALFGMMFGNVLLGTIADRIGRRLAISICVVLFSVFTAAAGFTHDPISFSVTRFMAGFGIGGVMPNVIAHMTEYSPKKIRSTMVTLMFSGYAVGGMVAALLGKGFIEAYGWQSVFIAAGAPLLLVPLIMKSMPESVPFLIKKGRLDEVRAVAARLDPTYSPQPGDQFELPNAQKAQQASLGMLFSEGRAISTFLFWIGTFMCLFMVYALSSWLTKLMAGAGYSLGSALTFVLVLNFGAMLGAIGGGWLADKFHIKYVLVGMYAIAAVCLVMLGYKQPVEVLFLLVGLTGATTIGTQIVSSAYVSQFYPASIRSTGVGLALGIGRAGAIIAPILIGVLVGMALPLQQNFLAIAIPAAIAAVAMLFVNHSRSASVRGF